jgi:hypothetical protein
MEKERHEARRRTDFQRGGTDRKCRVIHEV